MARTRLLSVALAATGTAALLLMFTSVPDDPRTPAERIRSLDASHPSVRPSVLGSVVPASGSTVTSSSVVATSTSTSAPSATSSTSGSPTTTSSAGAGGAAVPEEREDEVRMEGPCGSGAEFRLRVIGREDGWRVRWVVDAGVPGRQWSLSVSHDGVTIGSVVVTSDADGEAELRLEGVPDHSGEDTFHGSAAGPGGSCSATVTV